MFKIRYVFFSLWFLYACGDKTTKSTKKETTLFLKKSPDFQTDSAYQFIVNQIKFGPRVPGTKAHMQTANYLIETLKNYTAHVYTQHFQASTFDNSLLEGTNIIASFKPELKKRLLLNAHWDSRPFADQDLIDQTKPISGANDGASGVGLLLEIARLLSFYDTFNIGIDIVLFDLEDYGTPTFYQNKNYSKTYFCLGSQYWIKHLHTHTYKPSYSILVDMVAFKNSIFLKEANSLQYASFLLDKIWTVARKLNYKRFINQTSRTPAITHDHYFINQIGIPSIAIIGNNTNSDKVFIDIWHTHNDNIHSIDKATLKQVGQLLTTFIYNET